MSAAVYFVPEGDGFLRLLRGFVYKLGEEKQRAMRNHNPRVGGSIPSSATKFLAL